MKLDHGHTVNYKPTPEYRIWSAMKTRCYNPNVSHYCNYGGRGIFVCERWVNSFSSFLEDMGNRPSNSHTIERIDNNGPYSPENCRWASRLEQKQNQRMRKDARLITMDGVCKPAGVWARELGLNKQTVYYRIRHGWSSDELLRSSRQKRPK